MGPVMNILLALLLTALVLYQGVEKGSYEDQPPVVGVVPPDRRPRAPTSEWAIAMVSGGGTTASATGISSSSRSDRGPNREVSVTFLRNGMEVTRR